MSGKPNAEMRQKGVFFKGLNNGFAYMGALITVVVTGICLSSATAYWSTIMKRERETELFYRGDYIRKGIESYYKASNYGASSYPKSLKDLLRDSRYMIVKKHIRKIYKDPMTDNGDWALIYAPGGRIKGVFSKSKGKPLKTGNFPELYKDFEKAQTYADWKFVYEPKPPK